MALFEEFAGAAVEESAESVAEYTAETLEKNLAEDEAHRGASLADARGAKNSTAERTGLLASGIVSTREGRRIALFFSGHRRVGENLQDVLAQRPGGSFRADPDV